MSNYTQSTNFATKDALSSGDPLKIVRGTEINTEFTNIAVAVATKLDTTALAAPGPIGATTPSSINATDLNGGQLAGLRNKIINGNMRWSQRTLTGPLTTGYTYISVDRFAGIQGGTANGILAKVAATGLDAFEFAAKIGRNASATTTGNIVLRSALETSDSISLQGKEATFSFYAKAGANFSAASSNISVTVSTGTGTDQSLATMATWTGVATPITGTTSITTSWVRYSYTGTIAASATQVGVSISYTPVGTAGADDNLYITGVQLELGPVATPFEQRPYGMELALCQRYYQDYSGVFALVGTASAVNANSKPLAVPMRASFTVTQVTAGTGGSWVSLGGGKVLGQTGTHSTDSSTTTLNLSAEL